MLIKSAYTTCQSGMAWNESQCTTAVARAHAEFEKALSYVSIVDHRDGERAQRLFEFLEAMVSALPCTRKAAAVMVEQERAKTLEEIRSSETQAASILEIRDKRLAEAKERYEDAKGRLEFWLENLRQIAETSSIELEDLQ